MKWLTDIFGGKAVKDIGNVVDNLSTTTEEKAQVKNELTGIIFKALDGVIDAQREVLVTELKGNWLQRSWRPILMLAFGFIIVFKYFAYPVCKAFNPELPELPELIPDFWGLLKIGIGGYVIGRSVEKTAETVTRNVDIPFLRRKDRKKALKNDLESPIFDDGED